MKGHYASTAIVVVACFAFSAIVVAVVASAAIYVASMPLALRFYEAREF